MNSDPGHSSGWRRLLLGCTTVGAVLAAGCATGDRVSSTGPGCSGLGPNIACTAEGPVRGVVEERTIAFKGIPYAKPPLGAQRWQPPEPPQPWQGVRDASRFGPVCPQLAGQNVIGEEDCLTVNVWKPQEPAGQPLPVMVFLTGGGNHAFSGQGAQVFGGVNYNGHRLAQEGVIYVSFNNRLGALGFLAHPALSAERGDRVSGNYASLDQIAMLRWVRRNIAAFGGDPRRVMLFGTSAGGGNICALMTALAARGLFQAAAMQSNVPTGCQMQTLAEAESGIGQRVAQALGCGGAQAAACLRGKSAAEVVKAVPGTFGVLPRLYGPNVDGVVFPEQPAAVIARGAHAAMPVIIGNSTEETMLFVNSVGPVADAPGLDAALARIFGNEAVPRIRAAYPLSGYATPRHALVRITTDALFTCQSRRIARMFAGSQRQPVYRYLFAHSLQNDPEFKVQGAVHTVEHVFFFPWQGRYQPTAADQAVQRLMVTHWSELARSGTTNGNVLDWPASGAQDGHLRIGEKPAVVVGSDDAKCDFWDTQPLPWPHL